MIAGIFHKGSGLGNQLHRYVMTRVLAADKGLPFGMIYPENFKGADFMKLDMGVPVKDLQYEFQEKRHIVESGHDVRPYDFEVKDVGDFTLVDGEFQGEKYYEHHLDEIYGWLNIDLSKITVMPFTDHDCVIGFRGGEYKGVPDLFLKQEYWDAAIAKMKAKGVTRFFVVTDDPETAKQFFPDFQVTHDMANDWFAVHIAPNLILSNSSFYILPALLNRVAQTIIAPEFWAGHNKGYWQLEQNVYKKFTYI